MPLQSQRPLVAPLTCALALSCVIVGSLIAPPAHAAKEITDKMIDTKKDHRLFDEWVTLCVGVFAEKTERIAELAAKLTTDFNESTDNHIKFLRHERRTMLLDQQYRQLRRQFEGYPDITDEQKRQISIFMRTHLKWMLTQTVYNKSAEELFKTTSADEPLKVRLASLALVYDIYSAPVRLSRATLATLGDQRPLEAVLDQKLYLEKESAIRYWFCRICGLYPKNNEFKLHEKAIPILVAMTVNGPRRTPTQAAIALCRIGDKPKGLPAIMGRISTLVAEAAKLPPDDPIINDINDVVRALAVMLHDEPDLSDEMKKALSLDEKAYLVTDYYKLIDVLLGWYRRSPYFSDKPITPLPTTTAPAQ